MISRLGARFATAQGLLLAGFAVTGATAFLVTAERALDAEMSARTRAAARTAAAAFDPSLLAPLQSGSLAARTLADRRLVTLAEAAGASRLVLLDRQGRVLASSDTRLVRGERDPGLALYGAEATRAWEGDVSISAPYEGDGGAWYQAAWLAFGSGVLGAEVRVAYRASLVRLRRGVTLFALGGVVLAGTIGFVLAKRVTAPLARLSHAMSAAGANGLPRRSGVRGRDEVGRLGERFDALVDALERHDAELRELSATIAHEVRNPLGAMSGWTELLQRRHPEPETAQLIEGVREEIAALERLVSRFLSFAGDVRLSRRPTPICALLEDSIRSALAPDSRVRVARCFPAREGPWVDADADALREVFVNLLRNAAQAMDDQGEISLSLANDGRSVEISIADTGPGIPDEVRTRLFQPFTTTKANGTGLGLAICRRIVAGHGGSLRCETGKDGTTFRITVPCAPDPPRETA